MCLRPTPVPPVPEETARVAHGAFPKSHPYLKLRDEFGALFEDEQFAALFPTLGPPALAPWRLALVTLLQFAEGLSDRQAADAVRRCIDWKYLLALELTEPGFDFSVLSEFRARLIAGSAELLLFEGLLERFRTQRLLKARGKQRTDATHVLASVRTLNRLELVGETLHAALNALSVVAPEWLLSVNQPDWGERYGHRFEEFRLPKTPNERTALAHQIGTDGFALLEALTAPTSPPWLGEVPAVRVLRQVWEQQYDREEAAVRWRAQEAMPPTAAVLSSPYDPDARYGKKRTTEWLGYKVHLTETCEANQPLLITDVQTTPATTDDCEVLPRVQAGLESRALLPETHLVDAAYVAAAHLVESQERYGIDLVGPAEADTSWQARQATGFAASDFTVDWERQCVHCPAGKVSVGWHEKQGRSGPVIQAHFATADCRTCPCRSQCTRARGAGRRLTLLPERLWSALRAARERERTEAFRQCYAARAGIEGSFSQGARRAGLRQARYVGQPKVHLQQLLTAAALNLVRVGYWLLDSPRASTRQSAYLRLLLAA